MLKKGVARQKYQSLNDASLPFGIPLHSKVQEHFRLPAYEVYACVSVSLIGFSYGLYQLYRHSQGLENNALFAVPVSRHLHDGWLPGYRYEAADIEWQFISHNWLLLLKVFFTHTVVVAIGDTVFPKSRLYIFTANGILACLYLVGYGGCAIVLAQLVAGYVVISLTKRMALLWLLMCCMMYCYVFQGVYLGANEFLVYIISWNIIRIVSFADNYCSDRVSDEEPLTALHYLAYCLYTPTLIGPPVVYKKFHNSAYCVYKTPNYIQCVKTIATILIWSLFLEIIRHFFYIFLISHLDLSLISSLEASAIGWMLGWNMQAKYMVIYAIPKVFASLDNVWTPGLPDCISRVYLYTDMWRKFDKGLYDFISYHIYIPLGGNTIGGLQQLRASLLIFFFVWVWHGCTTDLAIWCVLNLVEVALERLGCAAFKHRRFRPLLNSLTPQSYLRIKALGCLVCFFISNVAIFCFFLPWHHGLNLAWWAYGQLSQTPFVLFVLYSWIVACFSLEYTEAICKRSSNSHAVS